jgi:murein DD-endopeptidase MepM/ murein hydrolase activator NlpD
LDKTIFYSLIALSVGGMAFLGAFAPANPNALSLPDPPANFVENDTNMLSTDSLALQLNSDEAEEAPIDAFEAAATYWSNMQHISNIYDIDPAKQYTVHEGVVGKNEFLSDILNGCNLSAAEISTVANNTKKIFAKNFKSEKPYIVLCDENQKAQCFIYEQTPTDYIVVDLQNGVNAYSCQKEVESRLLVGAAEIHGSLGGTMARTGLNPNLSISLAKAFAWSIDFFKIKDGDKFKAVYEQKYIAGKPIGTPELKAAYMQHKGEDFYAFSYYADDEDQKDYYDEKGKSVRKGFLKAPLKFTRISSRFSMNRFHPVLHRNKAHLGTDYAAPYGTPIMSVGDGVVLNAEYGRGNGNFVKIKHDGTYTTQYLHMSRFAKGVRRGVRVKQGQVIGYVGSTGLATGPHLCYRLWKNGTQVDPYRQKNITMMTKTVPRKEATAFKEYARQMQAVLDQTPYPIQQEDLNPEEFEEVALNK